MARQPDKQTLLDDPLSHGLWAHSASHSPSLYKLEGETTADVLVIGAGFTGLAAALRLTERGADVAVLEARDVGYGASGRNVGLVNAGLWLSPQQIVDRLGGDFGERLIKLLGDAPGRVFELVEKHDIPCEASQAGTLHCAHSASGFEDLRRRAAHWSARGAPVELLNRHEAAGKIGSDYFNGALLDHRAGTIQPLGYARGLARAAMQAGARIHTHSPVHRLDHRDRGWRAVTDTGAATAESVILATNAYTEHVTPIGDCVVPFSFFQMATSPLPDRVRETILPEGHGAWDTAKVLTSLRLDTEGRLIAGSIGRLDRNRRGVHARWLRRKILRVFPQLETVPFEHGWHGDIATTAGAIPCMSELEAGLVTAYGYNGRGIGTGTVFGPVLADFLLDRDPDGLPLPLTPLKPARFRPARILGIELGARALHFVSDRF